MRKKEVVLARNVTERIKVSVSVYEQHVMSTCAAEKNHVMHFL